MGLRDYWSKPSGPAAVLEIFEHTRALFAGMCKLFPHNSGVCDMASVQANFLCEDCRSHRRVHHSTWLHYTDCVGVAKVSILKKHSA